MTPSLSEKLVFASTKLSGLAIINVEALSILARVKTRSLVTQYRRSEKGRSTRPESPAIEVCAGYCGVALRVRCEIKEPSGD